MLVAVKRLADTTKNEPPLTEVVKRVWPEPVWQPARLLAERFVVVLAVSTGRGPQALIEAYGTTAAERFLPVEILPNIEPILRTARPAA